MVLFQEAPYEYLDTSGKAIGIVEIMKTLPEEVVHGRPLAQDEKKVVVKSVYPQGSSRYDDDEFVEGAFHRVKKVQLRKLQKEDRKVKKNKSVEFEKGQIIGPAKREDK